MILTMQANGTLLTTVPERVFQGSNNANTIAVVTDIARTNSLVIAFKLPQSAVWTTPVEMTLADNIDEDTGFNVWTILLESAMTQEYGNVELQVQSISPTGEVLGSALGSFVVERGVSPVLPATMTTTVYEQILANLSDIKSDIADLNSDIVTLTNRTTINIVGPMRYTGESVSYLIEWIRKNALTPQAVLSIGVGLDSGTYATYTEYTTIIDSEGKITRTSKVEQTGNPAVKGFVESVYLLAGKIVCKGSESQIVVEDTTAGTVCSYSYYKESITQSDTETRIVTTSGSGEIEASKIQYIEVNIYPQIKTN